MIRKDDSPKKITFTEIAKGLNQGLESADPARLAGLQTLQRVRAVKDTSLAREQERLGKKYGGQHPRVQAIAAKREANREFQRDLEVAVQRARTPAVTPDPNAWTLHGYVRDSALNGIQNLKVALYDERKRWVEEFGHACTDANGYFRLTPSAGAAPQAEEAPGVEDVQEKLSRAAAGKPAGRFYIHVTNADDVTLHIDDEPVTPKLGEVVYREIILGGDVETCPPPGGGKPTKPARGGRKDAGKGAGKDSARFGKTQSKR